MAIEDKHPDILQNIEAIIIAIYRRYPELRDADAFSAVEALVNHYRAKVMRREIPEVSMGEAEMKIYTSVIAILTDRSPIDIPEPTEKKRFSRAFKQQTPDEIYLACLRRIQKSIRNWNSRNGIRGYLDFVKNYV